jgi:hypothetical protein
MYSRSLLTLPGIARRHANIADVTRLDHVVESLHLVGVVEVNGVETRRTERELTHSLLDGGVGIEAVACNWGAV